MCCLRDSTLALICSVLLKCGISHSNVYGCPMQQVEVKGSAGGRGAAYSRCYTIKDCKTEYEGGNLGELSVTN